ncbi:unnamed protein product [Musa acuminata var. zebrina]
MVRQDLLMWIRTNCISMTSRIDTYRSYHTNSVGTANRGFVQASSGCSCEAFMVKDGLQSHDYWYKVMLPTWWRFSTKRNHSLDDSIIFLMQSASIIYRETNKDANWVAGFSRTFRFMHR